MFVFKFSAPQGIPRAEKFGEFEENRGTWKPGCSTTCSRTTGNFAASTFVEAGARGTENESGLWIFLSFHSAFFQTFFPFQETLMCLSFKVNTVRNRSLISWRYRAGWQPSLKRAPTEKTWRRELPTQASGRCVLNPSDWKLRSWITFSLLSRVSSTYTSCHCCLRPRITQSFSAHFHTHRFLNQL